jgi:hypothetical protein
MCLKVKLTLISKSLLLELSPIHLLFDLKTWNYGLVPSILFILALTFFQVSNVYAHNFYNNQNSIFFTLVKRFEIEERLSLENQSTPKELALNHSQDARNLFKQIVSLNNKISNSSSFSNQYDTIFAGLNVTTKALVVANLADQSLVEYALARGLDNRTASGLANMSMGKIMNFGRTQMNMSDMMSSQKSDTTYFNSTHKSPSNGQNPGESDFINQVNYQSSKMLASSLKTIFSESLQNATLQKSTGLMHLPMQMKINSVRDLSKGIDELILALNKKSSLEQVFSIVHGQIHPNLFLAYDLKLKGE